MEAQGNSRKRLRSDSVPSTASSPKRHTSGSPRTRPLDATDEIDAYMADQPNDAESLPPSTSQPTRFEIIDGLKRKPMEAKETWYLADRKWYRRWEKACKGEVDKEGPVREEDLGPVAVDGLVDQDGNLKPGLIEGVDVEYVPEEAWKHFVEWYGRPPKTISRKTIIRGMGQVQLELQPPRFRVLRLIDDSAKKPLPSSPIYVTTISARDSVKTLRQALAKAVSPTSGYICPHRVREVDGPVEEVDDTNEFSAADLNILPHKLIEPSDKATEDEVDSDKLFVVEFKGDNGWIVDVPGDEKTTPAPIFNSNDGFFNKMTPKSTMTQPSTSTALTPFSTGGGNSLLTSAKKLLTNGNTKTLEPGTLGLGNMGNTCFMNSALQCLAHNQELTEYFQNGVYHDELNPDNPLGMHGAIAEAFGALLDRIWASSGASTSYSPREFKSQLGRFAPQFSGYQQHDSQELVAFLLDGLHEDLNRVLKKPYVEKPDWEGGGDKELMKLAKDSWDGYKLRNDSVIVDLFQGQYQSTLVCPECQKVSITFDPFMYLTLPLPIKKKWRHTVYFVPWDLNRPHVKVPIDINKDSSFKDVRVLLARWLSPTPTETNPNPEPINPDNLLTLEIFNSRFYKNLDDNVPVSDMSDNDVIVCFELPCHAQQARSYHRDRDKEQKSKDPFVIPLFLADANTDRPVRVGGGYGGSYGNRGSSASLFGYPSVVVVTREQAKTVEGVYDAVVDRLQRWTQQARDLWTWEATSSSSAMSSDDEDIVKISLRSGGGGQTKVTEVRENGDVVEMHPEPEEGMEEEGDIADEKFQVINSEDVEERGLPSTSLNPVRVGVKRDLFTLRVQKDHKEYGTNQGYGPVAKYDSWDRRKEAVEEGEEETVLLEHDALYCEWDENMKAYYFGEEKVFEHAQWNDWEEFIHPEYEEATKKSGTKKTKGISLHDCLEEFTKEEKLGEDDLWYCPQCKKHQQATKRFDLWKVPDILVVHLKRFSNSRMLRDKIDAFVDFPTEGLDLTDKVGERPVIQRLKESGLSSEELAQVMEVDQDGSDEPLVYDLFGVDEHMGGLGGGHYRAYAQNHMNQKWYHFDDSYVTPAQATDAVNANAYLLFYRKRSSKPLGGKSHELTEAAKRAPTKERNASAGPSAEPSSLPTPPVEPLNLGGYFDSSNDDLWNSSGTIAPLVPSPTVPELEESNFDMDPPNFEDAQHDSILDGNDITIDDKRTLDVSLYQLPERQGNDGDEGSPVSSTGAEPDLNSDVEDWAQSQNHGSPPAWSDSVNSNSNIGSPFTSSSVAASPEPHLKDVTMEDVRQPGDKEDGLGLSL